MKNNITWDEKNRGLKKSIITKTATYKRGAVAWAGVGIAGDILTSSKGEIVNARSKANWYNNGFRPYPKGMPTGRTGRNWRKGLRGRFGQKIYDTRFFDKAYEGAENLLKTEIEKSIREALEDTNV